jgi:hypothetical protein
MLFTVLCIVLDSFFIRWTNDLLALEIFIQLISLEELPF